MPTEIEAIPLVFLTENISELIAGYASPTNIHTDVHMRMPVNPIVNLSRIDILRQVNGERVGKRAITNDPQFLRRAVSGRNMMGNDNTVA